MFNVLNNRIVIKILVLADVLTGKHEHCIFYVSMYFCSDFLYPFSAYWRSCNKTRLSLLYLVQIFAIRLDCCPVVSFLLYSSCVWWYWNAQNQLSRLRISGDQVLELPPWWDSNYNFCPTYSNFAHLLNMPLRIFSTLFILMVIIKYKNILLVLIVI